MTNFEYIKKQIEEHTYYQESIIEVSSAFSNMFRHPKSGEKITWSQKCDLINKDLDKRVKRIEKRLENSL